MTFEHALETVSNSLDEKERCSAIVALTEQVERAEAAMRAAQGVDGKVSVYAGKGLQRIRAAAGN